MNDRETRRTLLAFKILFVLMGLWFGGMLVGAFLVLARVHP